MGLLSPLPIVKGHMQRIGINFLTDQPILVNGHNSIVTFVHDMTIRVHLWSCRRTIEAPAIAYIFIDITANMGCLNRLHWTAMYASPQTTKEMSRAFCRRSCSCPWSSIQKSMVSLISRTRWSYTICVASHLTIKPIGLTTSHWQSIQTIPQYTIWPGRCLLNSILVMSCLCN